jgi:hypothetical protein
MIASPQTKKNPQPMTGEVEEAIREAVLHLLSTRVG